ncbi:MAG: VWA domain-containing protein [Synergistaceae bacterium]|nr:VWA domain-containing protein [Synergistaceae bacterium]
MRISNNLPALTAFNSLNKINRALDKTIKALSTGLRINSASDDAAGFAISEKMRSQLSGLNMAIRNSQDGISFLQTAEGALGETNSMLQRMRELAVQASNDSLTSNDRQFLQLEIDELKKQIDRIADTTQFNKKRILDGSSGAIWSSSDRNVKAKINGGLTYIDDFGQKVSSEGNYRIEVEAKGGQAQVQKTNIMDYVDPVTQVTTRSATDPTAAGEANVVFVLDVSGSMGSEIEKVKANIASFKSNIEAQIGEGKVNIGICTYGSPTSTPNFVAYTYPDGSLWSSNTSEINALLAPITAPYGHDDYNGYAVQKAAETYADTYGANRFMVLVTDVDHGEHSDWYAPSQYVPEASIKSALECDPSTELDNISLSVICPYPDDPTSEFYNLVNDSGGLMFQSGSDWSDGLVVDLADKIAEETGAETIEETIVSNFPPSPDTLLSNISSFISPSGNFLLERPQQITITQGDKSTTLTLDASDTLSSLTKKINDAIAIDLEQGKYMTDINHFASYVSEATNNGDEAVEGTIIIRSAIPGKAGELYFSGDEDLLNALGLNTIQESQEAQYTASVYDAHTGMAVATNVKSSAPEFKSLIPPDIDIEVDLMAGLSANWDEGTKRFMTARKDVYTAMLHLKDNGTVFQVGANEGEDFIVQLGDFSSHALGVSSINIMTRETASRAISTIDSAISKLGSQRAKIGAYENALEHTMENLTVTSANLTNAESRIRDADMSKTMMNFVKYQILNQSGTSMLAQANQLPQSVLNLIQ